MKAYAPNGLEIRGTLETVQGVALAHSFIRKPDGTLDFTYSGETDIFWDGQETVKVNEECIFLDIDGNEWPESKIEVRDEPSESPAAIQAAQDIKREYNDEIDVQRR